MRAFRFIIATIAAVALVHLSGGAMADAIKQVQLTEKQVESLIASQKEMGAIMQKMQGDKPDPKLQSELEAVAKKYGFASIAEFDSVSENVSLLMSCIDPKTKAFSEPKVAIQKQIDELKADKTIPEPQKKEMLADLAEQLKTAESNQVSGQYRTCEEVLRQARYAITPRTDNRSGRFLPAAFLFALQKSQARGFVIFH